jgi:hypothetical protein
MEIDVDVTVELFDSTTNDTWKALATIKLEHTGGVSPSPPIRHIPVLMGGLGDLVIRNLTNEGGKFLKITLAD